MDMKKILKDTAVLLVITLVSGLLLGLAYEVTNPIITARKEEEKAASYRGVFAEAASFESCEDLLEQAASVLEGSGYNAQITDVMAALDGSGAAKNPEGQGCMKPFWDMTEEDVSACLAATDWCRANYEYFRGGGFSSHFRCRAEMPVTMLRVNMVDGVGPVLQLAEGWTADLPDEIHTVIDKRTDASWPTTWFVPKLTGQGAFGDVYSVMANWGANHGVTVYGHVGAELITLASMLRIPVNMHNVEPGRVFRPHAWAAFGTEDAQSADYRACQTYGPLYG